MVDINFLLHLTQFTGVFGEGKTRGKSGFCKLTAPCYKILKGNWTLLQQHVKYIFIKSLRGNDKHECPILKNLASSYSLRSISTGCDSD